MHLKISVGLKYVLRACLCKFRESGDRAKISNFFLFYQNSLFGDLFSKIA